MLYRQRRKNRFSKQGSVLGIVGIVFVLVFIFKLSVPNGVVSLVHGAGDSLWQRQDDIRYDVRGILKLFKSKGSLVAKNQELTDAYEILTRKVIDYELLQIENERLLDLLGRIPSGNYSAASVLLHPHATPFDTLVIDAGSREGVSAGDRIFASDRIYLGVIERSDKDTSRVRLISSPNLETTVVLENSGIEVTAIGSGGGMIDIEVPRDVSVSIGERVLLPGIKNILVAKVGHTDTHPADAFIQVRAHTPVNIYTIPEIFIEQ